MTSDNPLPPPVPIKFGPPPKVPYEPDLALSICERVADGELLKDICTEAGNPTPAAFHGWVLRYKDLATVYAQARIMQGHFYFEKIIELANATADGDLDSKRAHVAISAFTIVAGRLAPKHYSERAAKTPPIAIQINTTLDLSNAKSVDMEDGTYHIEAHVVPQPSGTGEAVSDFPAKAKTAKKTFPSRDG